MTKSDDKQKTMSTIEKAMQRLRFSDVEVEENSISNIAQNDVSQDTEISSDETPGLKATVEINSTSKFCEIDLNELERKGFLRPNSSNVSLIEEYRVIKQPLLKNALGKTAAPLPYGNLIIITSALPGEGKTYNSLNLAISFAQERDMRILLIDSDVIKPVLTDIVGLNGVPGLTDLLSGEVADISDILYKSNIDKLTVIPAGSRHEHDTELLSSEKMKQLTEELAKRYPDRIVLFDAPPILATSHARVMAQYAGQIVLVVEAGKTLEYTIKDAVSQIDTNKAVGVILNKGRGAMGASYYGSYGSYGDYEEDK